MLSRLYQDSNPGRYGREMRWKNSHWGIKTPRSFKCLSVMCHGGQGPVLCELGRSTERWEKKKVPVPPTTTAPGTSVMAPKWSRWPCCQGQDGEIRTLEQATQHQRTCSTSECKETGSELRWTARRSKNSQSRPAEADICFSGCPCEFGCWAEVVWALRVPSSTSAHVGRLLGTLTSGGGR